MLGFWYAWGEQGKKSTPAGKHIIREVQSPVDKLLFFFKAEGVEIVNVELSFSGALEDERCEDVRAML